MTDYHNLIGSLNFRSFSVCLFMSFSIFLCVNFLLSLRNCVHFVNKNICLFVCLCFLFFSLHQPHTQKGHAGEHKFKWNSMEQNTILGSFFLGYVLTEVPGGRLAEMIGGHRVFGHSMLWASILTLVSPCAAFIDFKALVFVRALLGFMLGKLIPILPHCTPDYSNFIYLIEWLLHTACVCKL